MDGENSSTGWSRVRAVEGVAPSLEILEGWGLPLSFCNSFMAESGPCSPDPYSSGGPRGGSIICSRSATSELTKAQTCACSSTEDGHQIWEWTQMHRQISSTPGLPP